MPRFLSFAAPLVLLVSFLLMLRRVEPFYTNFYSIAWWCYIFWLASRNELRDTSRFLFPSLFRQPLHYVGLILLSSAVWFFFEIYNAHLHNWAYVGIPVERWIRWPGYFVAYGSVLPGIFETARWVEGRSSGRSTGGGGEQASPQSVTRWNPALAKLSALCGLACMILPLLYPPWFFPLIWAGLIFLLDPFAESIGERNLVANLFVGDRSRPLLLLASGLVCGFFWEFWNFWAGAKWIYTLPYFQFWKIFEMPVLGFLGFPPFALECWLLFVFVRHVWKNSGMAGRSVIILVIAAVCAAGIYVVDHFAVREYASDFRPSTCDFRPVAYAVAAEGSMTSLYLQPSFWQ